MTEPLQYTQLSADEAIFTPYSEYANPIYYQCPDDGKEYIIIAKTL